MLPLLAAGCTFIALLLLAIALVQNAARPADARVRALGANNDRSAPRSTPFRRRIVAPSIEAVGSWLASLLPAAFLRRTERRLVLAGQPLTATAFYTLVLTSAALFGGGYFVLIFIAASGTPPVMAIFAGFMLTVLGLYLPLFWLSNRAKARQAGMLRSLPDTLDLLTLCVEAGLGLEGALYRVVEKQSGPLAEEIRQTLREVGLGKSRRDALLDLAERTQLDDVRSLATALIQAEQLGTSAAKVLRVQAQRMRVRRRQHAEQDARRASVRMVFPLVFCLMPSLFLFILGPIFVSVYDFLSKS
jgi:tight adherence protein C